VIHVHRFVWNTALSLALNVTLRAAGVLTFIAIGRLGNVQDAGLFSIALGYLAILTTLFVGLDDLLVRESVCTPERTLPLLATFGVLRFALGITIWLVLFVILATLSLYALKDLIVVAIISGCILPDSLSALGQSVQNVRGHFGLPLVAVGVGTVIRIGGALFVLMNGQSLLVVALVWQLGSLFTAAIMLGALARDIRWTDCHIQVCFDSGLARYLARLFPAFSSTAILAGLEYQLDVIVLSVMLSREAVAQYSAAVTIMLVVQMIGQAYRVVLFPALVHSLKDSRFVARRLIGYSLVIMTIIALLAATGVTWFAPQLVILIYDEHFRPAVPVLQVLIWNVVFSFLNVPLVRFMMASDGHNAVWRTLTVSVVVNVTANFVLIPLVGVSGSAYARLCSSSLFCLLIGWQVFRRLHID